VRGRDRLTAISIRRQRVPGLYADGDGLYLQVGPTGTQSWIFKFMLDGRSRQMGLGSTSLIPLAKARMDRDDARRLLREGIDPIEARKAELQHKRLAAAKTVTTFKSAAISCIGAREAEWRNAKHIKQWSVTLADYVYPVFGELSVDAVDTALVLKALEPIWITKPETAGRVRGRIETVLDWAKARGLRTGENPARWRGHLDALLPKKSKVRRVKHHPALPYAEIGSLMATLRARESLPARALEFLILTAARSGEVLGARWDEIDLVNAMWVVPAERMKAVREHRVPLSARVVAILRDLPDRIGPVFSRNGRPLGHGALSETLGRSDVTVHGFRSCFRDWAAERTNFPSEVVEMALAHAVGNKVEAAYRRGDLIDKRRQLMAAWADYCGQLPATDTANVVQMRGSSQIPA